RADAQAAVDAAVGAAQVRLAAAAHGARPRSGNFRQSSAARVTPRRARPRRRALAREALQHAIESAAGLSSTGFLGCTAMSGAGEFLGTITAGGYRLVRALGGGRVWEARHDRLNGRFALKLFGEVDARAFQRTAQQALALRHPSIVRLV